MELDLHKTWNAQVNSNMSNIGTQISGATVIIEETSIGGIEGEKAKKRRGGYETGDEKQMGKVKVRAKVSTALKGNSTTIGISSIKNKNSDDVGAKMENGKKRRSTGMLMEGSRCSRVNGRPGVAGCGVEGGVVLDDEAVLLKGGVILVVVTELKRGLPIHALGTQAAARGATLTSSCSLPAIGQL